MEGLSAIRRQEAVAIDLPSAHEPSISKEEFLSITRRKYYSAIKGATPLFAWFSLTDECNLHCRYCFTDARVCTRRSESVKGELTTRQVFDVLDNVTEAGTTAIQFAGGEPLLRNDIAEIISYAVGKNIYTALNTNGTLVEEEIVRKLSRVGLAQVKVSVDGLRKNHEWNRGRGAFDKAISALKLFRDYGIPSVYLIMTLSKVNYGDLAPLLDLTAKLGVRFIMVEFLPVGHSLGKHKWVLSKEERRDAQRLLWKEQRKRGLANIQFENRYIVSEQEATKQLLAVQDTPCDFFSFGVGCISGIYSYMITADGKVATGCLLQQEVKNSDLLQRSLKDIWSDGDLFAELRDRERLDGKCGECIYRYVCGGCRRSAYIQTGRLMGPDPNCWVKGCTL